MRLAALLLLAAPAAPAQQPFTLAQILSAPYSTNLTAAPVPKSGPALFAWVEHTEGRNNLFIGGPNTPARQLTHNTEDDAQDITNLAWSPDASAIAYTFGAQSGADGHPANPAHLQYATPTIVIVQQVGSEASFLDSNVPISLGEGRSPLYSRDGKSILFLRNGKIWTADVISCALDKSCHPERSLAASSQSEAEGPATHLAALTLPAAFTHQLIFDRGSAHDLTLSPDGNILAYISRRSEPGQPSHNYLALYDLRSLTLTFPAPSTSNDSAPTFSPDGTHLAWLRTPFTETPEYTNPRTSPNPWSIQLLDLHTFFEGRHPERSEGSLYSPGSRTLYTPTPNQPGSVLPHLATGEPRLFVTSTNHIIFYSEADGWLHLYSLDPATKAAPVLITPGKGEVEDVSLSADRKDVFWASNIPMNIYSYDGFKDCMGPELGLEMADIERRHLSSLDVTKPPAPKPPKPNLLPDLFEAFGDFARKTSGQGIEAHPVPLVDGSLVALASDSFIPMHPVFVARDGSLTDVEKQWLPKTYPQGSLVFPEEVSFPSSHGSSAVKAKASTQHSDRQMLRAQIFLPGNTKASGNDPMPWCNGHKSAASTKNPERHPAILFFHGGPNRQMLLGYPAMDYYSNAYAFNQYLTSRGFIVLSVNYRCGIGYGLNFRQCQNAGPNGAAEYNDVLAARKYLASRPDVDPKRIGIWGGSYGGYLTALALARNSNLFAAGVDFHGVHDWNLEANASDWLVGTPDEKAVIAARALASSPLADISHWTSPILLIHGDNDPDVAYVQTPVLADALRARNTTLPPTAQVDVQELIFPNELHTFQLHRDWLAAYTAAAVFFERTLQPKPAAP